MKRKADQIVTGCRKWLKTPKEWSGNTTDSEARSALNAASPCSQPFSVIRTVAQCEETNDAEHEQGALAR